MKDLAQEIKHQPIRDFWFIEPKCYGRLSGSWKEKNGASYFFNGVFTVRLCIMFFRQNRELWLSGIYTAHSPPVYAAVFKSGNDVCMVIQKETED